MKPIALKVISCLVAFVHVKGYTLDDSKSLMNDMLNGYDRRHRPLENQSRPIEVYASFDLLALQDFDEVAEKFAVAGVLYITWRDEKITWNASSYNGITSQMYKLHDVWYPYLALGNPYESAIDDWKDWMTVRFYANGTAVFAPGEVFKATCSVDTSYYPYDTQDCYLVFSPWGYSLEELTLLPTTNEVLQTYFISNGEWTIESTRAYITPDTNFITFRFALKRKSLFLAVNVVLPIIFMSFINPFTFLIPVQSGERNSYAITCLLAIAVFLTLVSDNLPKTSKPMSIMCYYLMIILVASTVICLVTILNLRVLFTDQSESVPDWCTKFVRMTSCGRKEKQTKERTNKVNPSKHDKNTKKKSTRYKVSHKDNPNHTVDIIEEQSDTSHVKDITWKDVSLAVDKVCFLSFTVLVVVITGTFLGIIVNNQS